jgi:arylsulfatase A-like enzyme
MLPVSLKAVGYRCYHAGVWSAGGSARDSGFDRSCTVRGKEVVLSDDEAPGNAAEHKPEDAIAEGLCGFLKGHAQQTAAKPFFALVNLGDGMEGTQDDRRRERYAGRFDGGREALEKSRIERLWEMGMLLNTEFSPLLPAVEQGGAVQGRGVQHADFQRRMETQSARVEWMDQQLGRVLEQIKTMGAWDQTLVLVLSERSHHASSVPLHTPLRESGCGLHEAGIATPMIVHWPAGFRARGEAREHFVHAVDVAPTLLKVANVTWPKKTGEIAVPTADGVDILPVLRENKAPAARPLWWSCAGSRAYRLGDWKWISPKGKPVELYYLKQDRSELRDLADANFERVKEMELQWTRMADRFLGDWKDKSSAQGQ